MGHTGVSGSVTISDQRSYIKSEILRGKNPTEIHSASSEVCGESTVDRSTVSRWANRFRGGCVSIHSDTRPRSSGTSTDERSVKLVADALEEDHHAACENLSRATGAKSLQKNAQELASVARGWAIQSPYNNRPLIPDVVTKKPRDYG